MSRAFVFLNVFVLNIPTIEARLETTVILGKLLFRTSHRDICTSHLWYIGG